MGLHPGLSCSSQLRHPLPLRPLPRIWHRVPLLPQYLPLPPPHPTKTLSQSQRAVRHQVHQVSSAIMCAYTHLQLHFLTHSLVHSHLCFHASLVTPLWKMYLVTGQHVQSYCKLGSCYCMHTAVLVFVTVHSTDRASDSSGSTTETNHASLNTVRYAFVAPSLQPLQGCHLVHVCRHGITSRRAEDSSCQEHCAEQPIRPRPCCLRGPLCQQTLGMLLPWLPPSQLAGKFLSQQLLSHVVV